MRNICLISALLFFSVFTTPAHSNSKALRVICDEWPPYQITTNDQLGGFSTQIVKIVFSRMDIDLETIHVYPWKRAITMLEQGEADALFSANLAERRFKFALYPKESLVLTPWVIWSREEDNLVFDSLDDLIGKRVGMVRGYSYTPEFWSFVKKHKIYEETFDDEHNFKKKIEWGTC